MRVSKIFSACMGILLLVSCIKESPNESDYGYLNINLTNVASAELITKSELANYSQYSLTIRKKSDGSLVKTIDNISEGQNIELKVGTYIITASNTAPNAGWNTPLFVGTQEVTLTKDHTSEVDITCYLANTKVTVAFDESLCQLFTSYKAIVSNGVGEPLEFDSESGAAYFAVTGSLRWSVSLITEEGIKYQSDIQTISDVKARQHYHLTYKVRKDETNDGAAAFVLVVEDSYTEKDCTLVAGDSSYAAPEIISDLDFSSEVIIPQGANLASTITLRAEAGIKQVLFNHNNESLALISKWNSIFPSQNNLVGIDFNNEAKTEATLDLDELISSLQMGEYEFFITIIDNQNNFVEQKLILVISNPIEAEAVSARAWAQFAILTAKWNTSSMPDGFKLQYRLASDTEWIDCLGEAIIDNEAKKMVLELYGLSPLSEYIFRAVSTKDFEGVAEIGFSTEATATVPNLNFDNWYKDGSAWMPNASGQTVWDSANPGSASMGAVPTTPEESIVAVQGEGKKAAKLKTSKVLSIMAAGNIYTGQFSKVAGLGAELKWGYGFNARPIALKGYLRYDPVTIDMTKSPYDNLKGQQDQASVKIFLTDWKSQFIVNTSTGTFLHDDDPSIIAMGALYTGTTNGQYIEFVIPIEYRDINKIPAFITIGCASSRYGDYFTGGVGSTLYLDEFSLVYDPAELTEAQKNLINYR